MDSDLPGVRVIDPGYWSERLKDTVLRREDIHHSIYVTGIDNWNLIQSSHAHTLMKLLEPGQRVLDGGCGYGALADCLPYLYPPVSYVGVDICPDLIHLARKLYPDMDFYIGDLKKLPYSDRFFHWGICRSLEGMVKTNVGEDGWQKMQDEMLRVCKRVLLLGYTFPTEYEILEA